MTNIFSNKKDLSQNRKKLLDVFQKNNSIHFKDICLLNQAFIHRSYTNEENSLLENNERLEFLGDSVLGMITAGLLYDELKGHPEGDLARIKSVVVSEATLSDIAVVIGIDKCLLLGKGEENSGGRQKKALLADAVEAVIGAYYIDSGYKAVQQFVLTLMVPEVKKVIENKHHRDYKTLLQEFTQKQFKVCPVYRLDKKTGPDHDRTFWMSVTVNEKVFGPAQGKNKKEAEQAVAALAWNSFNP